MQNVKRYFNLSIEFHFMLFYSHISESKIISKTETWSRYFYRGNVPKTNTNFQFFIFLSKALIENNKTETFK